MSTLSRLSDRRAKLRIRWVQLRIRWVVLLALTVTLVAYGGALRGRGAPVTADALAAAQPGQPAEAYRRSATWLSDPAPIPPGLFLEPRGIAVDPFDGTVLVVDGGNDRVQLLAPTGAVVRVLGGPGSGPEALDDPRDVAVQGSLVFVTDYGHDRVALFSVDGAYVGEWPGLAGPWGIAASADGRVFVVLNRNSQVAVFNARGQRLATWGGFGDQFGQLNRPQGADVMPDGRLLVADAGNGRIKVLNASGQQVDESRMDAVPPLDLAIDASDDIYAVHQDGTVRRYLSQLGLPPDPRNTLPLVGAAGIAAAPDGSLYATFQDDLLPKHGVHRWRGTPLRDDVDWGGVPAPLGRLDGPSRLAWDGVPGGGPLVADTWRRVQHYDFGGRSTAQVPAPGTNDLAPGPGGDLFLVRDDALMRLTADGTVRWRQLLPAAQGNYAWAVAVDYDQATDRVGVLDLGGQRLRLFTGGGTPIPAEGWGFQPALGVVQTPSLPITATAVALWDMARAPGRAVFVVNRTTDQLELRRATGQVQLAWSVPGRPLRVASDAAGNAFVLNRVGWVWKFAPSGALLAVWRSGEPADAASTPADLTVDGAGRVLVADSGLNRIEVYEVDLHGQPGPVPSFDPTCSPAGEKFADPTDLWLGQETTVTLRVRGTCPTLRTPLDVILVLDHSGSMSAPSEPMGTQTKMDAAKAAALDFLGWVDFGQDRVGVVGFNQDADLAQGLSANKPNVGAAIGGMQAGGGTDIAKAVDEARRELTGARRRPAASSVIVLMTDGGNNLGPAPALRAADQAKLEGARVITVGYGPGADAALLSAMASGPADYYFAPSAMELAPVYRAIATRLAAKVLFTQLTVTDELPANMAYVAGSGVPVPAVIGQVLVWQLADVPLEGIDLTYRVLPLEVGTWPTNVVAAGEGSDGLGQRGRVAFPVPVVVVRAPTGTPPPSPTSRPTVTLTPSPTAPPTPTLTPGPIYLPLVLNEVCTRRRQHVDVVLVIDTSDSMLAHTSAGRTKLAAAVAAAGGLLDVLDLDRPEADAAAIVRFNSTAAIAQSLTTNRRDLRQALAGLPQGPGTRIDLGLQRARDAVLGVGRHAANLPVVILLTDGRPTGTTDAEVLAAAKALKAGGAVRVYAIGLGEDVDPGLLGQIATGPGQRILASDGESLAPIYAEIARELPCVVR